MMGGGFVDSDGRAAARLRAEGGGEARTQRQRIAAEGALGQPVTVTRPQ